MAIPIWPVTLPQALLFSGYGQQSADVLLRTSMDTGPAKVRRRASAGVEPTEGKIILTSTELGYLRTFYDTTLLGGALRFSWKDPITKAVEELRITKPPAWITVEGLFQVTLSLEIMP